MRVLLVEDEHRLSNVIKKGLEEDGFAVDAAYDGEEGLYMAESENYDLIVLDVMLPKTDGVKICRQLRSKNNKIVKFTIWNMTWMILIFMSFCSPPFL